MSILKLQCMNKDVAEKCADQLTRQLIRNTQLKSAVVVLISEGMKNSDDIQNIAVDFGAYTVRANSYDRNALLN